MHVEQLLDAMEGVAYLTDPAGKIIAVGRRGWTSFAAENALLTTCSVIGTSLFDTMSGKKVREVYRRLHSAVAGGRRTVVRFEFRCDAPIVERHMRMSITGVRDGETVGAVLYQSQITSEIITPPRPLFDRSSRMQKGQNARAGSIVLLCAFCQRVTQPQSSNKQPRRWVEVIDYYRRNAADFSAIEDTVCPACERMVLRPLRATGKAGEARYALTRPPPCQTRSKHSSTASSPPRAGYGNVSENCPEIL